MKHIREIKLNENIANDLRDAIISEFYEAENSLKLLRYRVICLDEIGFDNNNDEVIGILNIDQLKDIINDIEVILNSNKYNL